MNHLPGSVFAHWDVSLCSGYHCPYRSNVHFAPGSRRPENTLEWRVRVVFCRTVIAYISHYESSISGHKLPFTLGNQYSYFRPGHITRLISVNVRLLIWIADFRIPVVMEDRRTW